jgi:hypothetical protein
LKRPCLSDAAASAIRLIVEESADTLPEDQTATLALYLSADLLPAAEAAITQVPTPVHVPPERLALAIEIARQKKNIEWLLAAAERSSGPTLERALDVAQEIGGAKLAAELMVKCADGIARLHSETIQAAWSRTLHGLGDLDRSELLVQMSRLAPVMAALGGSAAIEKTAAAIGDVGRWWP